MVVNPNGSTADGSNRSVQTDPLNLIEPTDLGCIKTDRVPRLNLRTFTVPGTKRDIQITTNFEMNDIGTTKNERTFFNV